MHTTCSQKFQHYLSHPSRKRLRLIEITAPKQKVTGVLLTLTIKLYLKLLKFHQVDKTVTTLIGTLVKISEILYAQHFCRTPRTVLQFYNVTWIHHITSFAVSYCQTPSTKQGISYLEFICMILFHTAPFNIS